MPAEVVFHPNWWHQNYGISFDKDYFFDADASLESTRRMREELSARFPELGDDDEKPVSRPIIGGALLAAGFMISGIMGCDIRYSKSASPEVISPNLTEAQIEKLRKINIFDTAIMQDFTRLIKEFKQKFGYVEGDINWEGVQNVALNLRGQQLFLDYFESPDLADVLLQSVADVIVQFLEFMASETDTSSVSVNRIVRRVDPKLVLHSNCTITMISAEHYRQFLLKYDHMLAAKFQPYGIHYCGQDLERMASAFAEVKGLSFVDVGWGSDVEFCRAAFPDKFLSLRLSPMRMLSESPKVIAQDINDLLKVAAPLDQVGLCCINVDNGTPDENIQTILRVAADYHDDNT
ncbi:uroporphyrinogen decarboxylase family protein [Candidatus Neomarinimicrobiota bacterium]